MGEYNNRIQECLDNNEFTTLNFYPNNSFLSYIKVSKQYKTVIQTEDKQKLYNQNATAPKLRGLI